MFVSTVALDFAMFYPRVDLEDPPNRCSFISKILVRLIGFNESIFVKIGQYKFDHRSKNGLSPLISPRNPL